MKVRKAFPEEYDIIYQMGFDVWGDGQTLDAYLSSCKNSPKYQKGQWYVLVDEQGMICSSLIQYSLSSESCGIGSIATPSFLRNKGNASKLITDTIKIFEEKGFKQTFLFSDIDSKFYGKFGFVALPQKHQHHQNSVCMVRGIEIDSIKNDAVFQAPRYF